MKLGHDEPIQNIGLDIELESELLRHLVMPLRGADNGLVELRAIQWLLSVSKLAQQPTGAFPARTNGVHEAFEIAAPFLPSADGWLGGLCRNNSIRGMSSSGLR